MPQSDYNGAKCCIGALLVVALLMTSMSSSSTSFSMPPVACIYGADCKMPGTKTDLKCGAMNCTAQFHRLCSTRAEEKLCNHATCGCGILQGITASGASARLTHHAVQPLTPKSTLKGTSAFMLPPPSRQAVSSVRSFGHSGAAAGKVPLTGWQQYLKDNMAYVQENENLRPTEVMKVLAQRWKDRCANSKDVEDDVSRQTSVQPGCREENPVGFKRLRGFEGGPSSNKVAQTLVPATRRTRTLEMHHNIILSAQESDKDRGHLNFLGGHPTLWETDPSNSSRSRQLVSGAPVTSRAVRDSSGAAAQRQERQEADVGKKAFTLQLDAQYGGASLGDLSRVKTYLEQPRSGVAARYTGVSRKYTAAVLGAFQQQGEVPPANVGRGHGEQSITGKTAGENDFSKEEIIKIRQWILDQNRQGLNVFAKGIRAQIKLITGRTISRNRLQNLRALLGIVFSKVVGAAGAKLSRRVRQDRYRFCKRRQEEDRRLAHLRPIRVYSDETYCHANHSATHSWTLTEKAWRDTVLAEAAEKVEQGVFLIAPTNTVGMAVKAGAQLARPSSGKGGRAVIVNALFALPSDLSDQELSSIIGLPVFAGPVPGVLTIWAAAHHLGDYHGNFTNSIYLHWLDSLLIPALIELSKKNNWRPITFILDGASYHTASYPSSIEFSKLTREDCVLFCEALRVRNIDLAGLPQLKTKSKDTRVGASVEMDALKKFLRLRLPTQQPRAHVLFHLRLQQHDNGNGVPNRELWVIDEEPSYHFELQATEEGWGVVKVDIAQSPLFNLAAVMAALESSFERLWTPELCAGLVRRCRTHEARFFLEDHKIFGVNGDEEDMECSVAHCSIRPLEKKSGALGENARSIECRRCKFCEYAFHRDCLVANREIEIDKVWPEGKRWCLCGCDVEDGEESRESGGVDELEEEEASTTNESMMTNFSAQIDVLLAVQHISQGNLTGGGAARMVERRGRGPFV